MSHPMAHGNPPAWASEWGEDPYGVFAGFTIDGVTQRMRWIPKGRFKMGSPDDEPGRDDDEGPVHEVAITRGFWLGDTPCTQAMWETVMGKNPSEFPSADRPVEKVSVEDVESFLEKAAERVDGLGPLLLPTEAQWEYACRAQPIGPDGAPRRIARTDREEGNLDEVAWYHANSKVGGEQRTQPVAQKRANSWGLYDMLGNVYEWCSDMAYRPYEDRPEVDPTYEKGSERVIRGGSWFSYAREVRAAYRSASPPVLRWDILGFRVARGQED